MSSSDDNIVPLTEGISIQSVDNDAILIVRCATIQREAIEVLYAWLEQRMNVWPVDRPWLVIYDLSMPGSMLTPYMRGRVGDFAKLRQDVKGRVAFLMRRDTTAALLSLYAATRTANSNRPLKVIYQMDEALAWMRELL